MKPEWKNRSETNTPRSYLVTGGCGFIGGHLCHALVAAGHRVRILDDLSTGHRSNAPSGADLIVGDVADPEASCDAVAGIDGVFHLAAIASVERCNLSWADSHRTNMGGTVQIMQAARDASERPIPVVWASSAAVYGAATHLPIHETITPDPLSPYGADKLGGEMHGAAAARVFGLPNTALRLFNVYGPGQDPRSPYSGVISIFADRMTSAQPITIFGDGDQSRDFVYVGDVVRTLDAAMRRLFRDRKLGRSIGFDAVNVCTGRATTIRELAETLRHLTASPHDFDYAAPRAGDIRDSVGDPSRMMQLLNIRAETSLVDGLRLLLGGTDRRLAAVG